MDWSHGYYASTGYSYGYYQETMPLRLHWAALVQNSETPTRNFRYLDAGCGQGLNLILAACSHPDSEFVGIDFMPEHVGHGRKLAERLGLTNITFIEGDFIELAKDTSVLGEFDYAVCHGISTWISPDVRNALFNLVSQVLKPGGVFYNSYNTHPGWLAAVPFQHLVLLEQRSKGGAGALKAAQEAVEALRAEAPAFDKNLPGLQGRLEAMKTQDPSYLLQEYNNHHWQPVFVSEMIDAMEKVKLSYLGTASISEAFATHIPPALRDRVAAHETAQLREQLRDYAIVQGFRRDLYVKGQRRFLPVVRTRLLNEQRFVVNPFIGRPKEGEPFKIRAGGLELNGQHDHYTRLLDSIAAVEGGLTLGAIVDAEPDKNRKASVVETICMMLHGGWIVPYYPEAAVDPKAQILALAQAVSEGAPYRYLPLVRTGGATSIADTDWLVLRSMLEGTPDDQQPKALVTMLAQLNRVLVKDGKPIKDPEETRIAAEKSVKDFKDMRLPFLRQVGSF